MGFMSRRVLPVCGSFCVCCPALRSRSRQPVKRYKKLIADVFPKSQEELPNDRKISKLCEYASKNHHRIRKIATSLEQKAYREVRNEHLGSVRVIMAVYVKLFSTCKGQMSLFAVNVLNLIKTLLDQTRQDEMRVLGCNTLYEFAYSQVDGTYFHHLDELLWHVCLLAEETGQEERRNQLRAAGLQALSSLIWYMGENSQMPSDYNQVVSVIMENYDCTFAGAEENAGKGEPYHYWVEEVVKGNGRAPMAITDSFTKLSFRKEGYQPKDLSGASEAPSSWAKTCVEKIAQFATEVTTTRRFTEPIFLYFDMGKHWSLDRGLALAVLRQMLHSLEKSGSDCFLLAALVKHLDHKNLSQQPQMKVDIVKVVTRLARQSKSEATIVEVNVLTDMLKHLRMSLQLAAESSNHEDLAGNKDFQSAIEESLLELAWKVGDSALIFEMMASTLEKLSSVPTVSRSTIKSLSVMGSVMASAPSLVQMQQNFPEGLLHQLSLAMVHSDCETRVGAHEAFEIVLVLLPTWTEKNDNPSGLDSVTKMPKKSLLKSASDFTSANVLLGSFKKDHQVLQGGFSGKFESADGSMVRKLQSSDMKYTRDHDLKVDNMSPSNGKELEMAVSCLSGDQVAMVLSAIWSEANMDNNLPANYEAMSRTFDLTLSCSSRKSLNQSIFVLAFQLALSLRTIALDTNAHLSPCRQRSLFVLSVSSLMVALKVHNIPCITIHVKGPLSRGQVDPFLELDDCGLRTTKMDVRLYGTPAMNNAASEFLALVRMDKDASNDTLVSLILSSLSSSFETELSSLREELLRMFSPDDGFTNHLDWASVLFEKIFSFDEAVEPKDDLISDMSSTDVPQLLSKTPIYTPSLNVIGVSQLLESALETAGQVAGAPVAVAPLPYAAVAMRCEAFGTNARKKMAIWMNVEGSSPTLSLMGPHQTKLIKASGDGGYMGPGTIIHPVSLKLPFISANEPKQTLQLPPVSHYDNFLRAAGC